MHQGAEGLYPKLGYRDGTGSCWLTQYILQHFRIMRQFFVVWRGTADVSGTRNPYGSLQ